MNTDLNVKSLKTTKFQKNYKLNLSLPHVIYVSIRKLHFKKPKIWHKQTGNKLKLTMAHLLASQQNLHKKEFWRKHPALQNQVNSTSNTVQAVKSSLLHSLITSKSVKYLLVPIKIPIEKINVQLWETNKTEWARPNKIWVS